MTSTSAQPDINNHNDLNTSLSTTLPTHPRVSVMDACQQASVPPTNDYNPAMVDGVWKSDGSRHTLDGQMMGSNTSRFSVTVAARSGQPTIRVAYFFSGIFRKASIGNSLKELCEANGFGLLFEEIDILVGGSALDLLDRDSKDT